MTECWEVNLHNGLLCMSAPALQGRQSLCLGAPPRLTPHSGPLSTLHLHGTRIWAFTLGDHTLFPTHTEHV